MRRIWYYGERPARGPGRCHNGRRLCSSIPEGTSAPSARGGEAMITYSELFQFCLVIIGILGLVLQIWNMKKK